MQLKMSPEVVLSQLGYSKSDNALQQVENIINKTKNFDKFAKHIISLNDHLKKMNAYVAMSNSSNFLKIKCDEHDAKEILEEFHEEVSHWANKYNVALEKLNNKHVYYILGTSA
jgi:protein subunit release factor A